MRTIRTHLGGWLAAAALLAAGPRAAGQFSSGTLNVTPRDLERVDVAERLGEPVPLDATILDTSGRAVTLGERLGGKPSILVLGYYSCPLVCPLILDRLLGGLNGLEYTPGEEFNVVVVSFDPRNTTAQARGYESEYRKHYKRPNAPLERGWTFHTGDEAQVRRIADAIGYRYNFLPRSGEYAHPVVLTVLTPRGAVSRYIYGLEYDPRDLRLALLEASEGKIARSLGDRLLLFCYHFDPRKGSYTLAAFRVMQLGAGATATLLGMLLCVLWGRERRRRLRATLRIGAPAPGAEAFPAGALAGPQA